MLSCARRNEDGKRPALLRFGPVWALPNVQVQADSSSIYFRHYSFGSILFEFDGFIPISMYKSVLVTSKRSV